MGRFVPGTGQDPGAPAVCTRPNARSSSPKSGVIPAQKSDGRPPGGPFVPGPRYNIIGDMQGSSYFTLGIMVRGESYASASLDDVKVW